METIRTFTMSYLDKNVVASDIDIMDAFIRKNYIKPFRSINYGMLGKKAESIRKFLWEFKKDGLIEEVKRIHRPITNSIGGITSDEIFYKLK